MRVGVGSRNPVKVAAVERARPDATVEPVAVDSGVPDQPRGHAETRAGAENRARRALRASTADAPGYDRGVGVEGGVARLTAADGRYLVMWAAVTDGDRMGRGAGPALRLPDDVAARVDAGEELGPVMDDVVGESDVKRDQGAAGVLTGGTVDRESCLVHAVAGALGPFLTDHYDE